MRGYWEEERMGERERGGERQGLNLSYNSWAQDTCSQKIGSGFSQGSTMCHFHPARLPSAYLILMCKSIFQGLNFPSSFFMVSTSISLPSNRGGWMIQKLLLQKERESDRKKQRGALQQGYRCILMFFFMDPPQALGKEGYIAGLQCKDSQFRQKGRKEKI